ncbi:putative transmembrane protein [Gregarina niphandrodes]|uniref:Transmembrane protein n=1 Tax=Gregarina niphandrodes TaxID=110365 RepID=A0A023AXV0_GRENI|nr:putative transmembrane protein [Gregarina niphandrodes]EZG43293.1 putative transmembrane protein [Gregarina niphandrodes]|eukprot:XP_011133451.1 putative transmembrane protein [Gregarina niphandrodes]
MSLCGRLVVSNPELDGELKLALCRVTVGLSGASIRTENYNRCASILGTTAIDSFAAHPRAKWLCQNGSVKNSFHWQPIAVAIALVVRFAAFVAVPYPLSKKSPFFAHSATWRRCMAVLSLSATFLFLYLLNSLASETLDHYKCLTLLATPDTKVSYRMGSAVVYDDSMLDHYLPYIHFGVLLFWDLINTILQLL